MKLLTVLRSQWEALHDACMALIYTVYPLCDTAASCACSAESMHLPASTLACEWVACFHILAACLCASPFSIAKEKMVCGNSEISYLTCKLITFIIVIHYNQIVSAWWAEPPQASSSLFKLSQTSALYHSSATTSKYTL